MKKILFFIPVLFFLACNLPDKQQNKEDEPMKFAAVLPSGQKYDILANGDSIFYKTKDTSVLLPVTYKISYNEIHPKGTNPPANQPPVANAGRDTTIQLPANSLKLNASASVDPEGQPLRYFWRQISGPSQATMTDSNKAICTASNLKAGTYTFEVRGVDPLNAFSADFVTVVVKEVADPPTGNPLPFSVSELPIGDPDLNRQAAGAEQWHDRNEVNLGYTPSDVYYRFVSTRIATGTRGQYNWSYLDGLINSAINKRQKLTFGIMTSYPEGTTNEGLVNIGNGTAAYPAWLQSAMSGEWLINGSWVPNYNDPAYLAWVLELNQAIYNHLQTGSFNGVRYKDVISSIDIRSYGSWGEWHSANLAQDFTVDRYPAGTFPTAASLKKIVDAYIIGFPDIQLSCMIAAFDAGWFNNTKNPAEIAHYVLTQRNQRGYIGWRRDQWGATDQYLKDYLENNNRSFNGLVFKDSIMAKWKTAPITGEPPNWNPGDYYDLERQIRLYHATSFGNGNYGGALNSTAQSRVKASSKAAGYRIVSRGGTYTIGTNSIKIVNNWQNIGLSPTYENWNVTYELVNASGAVTTLGVSSFNPRLYLPSTQAKAFTDNFPLSVPSGTYTLRVVFKDPAGYRNPLYLQMQGRNADGSYNLKTGIQR